ncbi:MAG: VanW family protein [Coriobacteriia bacterium]|nr:VanW family protein [Coriobacteriia bacterium]
MKLSDKELLKSVLYDDRHEEANDLLDENRQTRRAAAQQRAELIEREKNKKRGRRRFYQVAVPIGIVLLLVGGLVAYEYLSSWGQIHRNVTVIGIDVGGKTLEEAQEYLSERLASYKQYPVTVSYLPGEGDFIELPVAPDDAIDDYIAEDGDMTGENGETEIVLEEPEIGIRLAVAAESGDDTDAESAENASSDSDSDSDDAGDLDDGSYRWEIMPVDIGLSFDTSAAVEQAYAFGREGNVFEQLRDRILSYFEVYYVELVAFADDEIALETFTEIRETTDEAPVDSGVKLEGGNFEVVSGSDGVELAEKELIVRMANAVLERNGEVTAPLYLVPRDIDDENATRAARTAETAVSLPVEVSYGESNWTLESGDLVQLIDFERNDELEEEDVLLISSEPTPTTNFVLETLLVVDEVQERVVSRFGAEVGKAPVNARFSVRGGEVTIRPSEMGSGVDTQQLTADLADILMILDESQRNVEITLNEVRPRRTTEDAEAMGITERISSYTTNFSANNRPRVNNIQLIAQILDGTIIAPGEEFSFNGTTGQRTAARGFQEAGAIIRGEMSTSIGGGICQVSTTLFNATMLSGVQITQRINHSTFLSAYPPGRDATVAWNGPDFRFRNTLDNYILIATASTNSSVTISFFGTDPGYDIDVRSGAFRRSNFSTTERRDNTLPRGRRVVERAGQRGGNINVYYTVRDGNTVVREQTFTSRYRAIDEIVRVGTMREAPPEDDNDDDDNGDDD